MDGIGIAKVHWLPKAKHLCKKLPTAANLPVTI